MTHAAHEPMTDAGQPVARKRVPDSRRRRVVRRLLRDRVTLVCGTVLLLILLMGIFAPFIAPYDPYEARMPMRLKPVGTEGHLLGTDELGRDMLSRLIHGTRLSLAMGFLPVALATILGGTFGLIAGYAGGRWGMLIMRTMDVFYAFPSVLLAVAISGALGAGLLNAIVAMTLVFIPPVARVTETVTAQVRAQDYIEAARATGAGAYRIVTGHLLGNVLAPVLIYASSLISVSIVIASGLSFLGLGVRPPQAEWGLMLNTLRPAFYAAPMIAILPGLMIFLTSMCFNFLSDGLRNATEVKI